MKKDTILTPELKSVQKSILNGEIYAYIASVAKSGMSRRILFYRVNKGKIERVTAEIAQLAGIVKIGEYKQGQKYLIEDGVQVGGCGMDMVLHTLSNCLPEYGQGWNQEYKWL